MKGCYCLLFYHLILIFETASHLDLELWLPKPFKKKYNIIRRQKTKKLIYPTKLECPDSQNGAHASSVGHENISVGHGHDVQPSNGNTLEP